MCKHGFKCVVNGPRDVITRYSWALFKFPSRPKIGIYCEYRGKAIAGIELNKRNFFRVFVIPKFRGSGVGKCLLNRLIKLARRRGVSYIALTVDAHNKPALNLYRKFKFRICFLIRRGEKVLVLMMLPLKPLGACLKKLLSLLKPILILQSLSKLILSKLIKLIWLL